MKSLVIRVSKLAHLIYLSELTNLIAQEAAKSNMLAWEKKALAEQISKSNACLALHQNQLVGYVGLIEWNAYIEISALIVKAEFRQQKIGSSLVKRIINVALERYPDKEIIILPNKISSKISLKLGFQAKAKNELAQEIWSACTNCKEVAIFPDCHCQPMIFQKGLPEPERR